MGKKLLLIILLTISGFILSETRAQDYSVSGTINGHEYVDLGLPSGLKWATCNVGASSPSDFGEYFVWGITKPDYDFSESDLTTYQRNFIEIGGNMEYDAARAHWGGSWRLPTKDECRELIYNCKCVYTMMENINGYMMTGPNGNSIFLPVAGYRDGKSASLRETGIVGDYWSSTPGKDPNDSKESQGGVYEIHFSKYGIPKVFVSHYLYAEYSVRPVTD